MSDHIPALPEDRTPASAPVGLSIGDPRPLPPLADNFDADLIERCARATEELGQR